MRYVSKLFRAYRLYNYYKSLSLASNAIVSKLFRAYRLYNNVTYPLIVLNADKFQSSFELTGYITKFATKSAPTLAKCFKALSSLQVI